MPATETPSLAPATTERSDIVFERGALYDEVWSTPLTTLGKKYGLSDNGIRKICKAMSIPLPKAGHWAKVAAGHHVPRTPLPPVSERTHFVSRPGISWSHQNPLSDTPNWLSHHLAAEDRPENEIVVPSGVTKWHPAIAPLRQQLLDEIAQREASRKAKARPRLRFEPELILVDSTEPLLGTRHKRYAARVSEESCSRALRILNTICIEAERRGFVASMNAEEGRLELKMHEEHASLRISEKVLKTPNPDPTAFFYQTIRTATGILSLYMGNGYTEKQFVDKPSSPLEAQLNTMFKSIARRIHLEQIATEERRQEAIRRKEQEARWAEEQRQRKEAAARAAEEKRKQDALINDAINWQRAQLVRSYVEHILQTPSAPPENKTDWAAWAMDVAAQLDPTDKPTT
ncbi:MAG TPA: hypothetical protein VLC92_06035 [Rhodocyclaceae bacterium]|nr:hypothetical protein [Rhodocyclaceae bacterium]